MATMIESAEDIIRRLNWDCDDRIPPVVTQKVDLTNEERKLLISISEIPDITPGMLSKMVGIPIQNVLAMLLEMELKEWISVEPGNRYRTRISLS